MVESADQAVSILARSGDRALRRSTRYPSTTAAFQSSPGLVTGRYFERKRNTTDAMEFQSSPGLVTGRYKITFLV